MARIFIQDSNKTKCEKIISCTKDFIIFFNLDTFSDSFEQEYEPQEHTVGNLMSWINEKLKIYKGKTKLSKWQSIPISKAKKEVIPILSSLNSNLKVSIF